MAGANPQNMMKTMNNTKEIDNIDMVNHPSHYQTESGLEVIDIIAALTEDLPGILAVDTGNAIKYLARWKKKNGVEDLKKARWYIDHMIQQLEG